MDGGIERSLTFDETMLTIFACPKPFTDPHIAMIQRNAIKSWVLLNPRPEIILFGDEPGVAEASREYGVRHVAAIHRNERGTPFLPGVFREAEEMFPSETLCYINADIILMDDFCSALEIVSSKFSRFLMGGRPWNLPIDGQMELEPGWQNALRKEVMRFGELRSVLACDYFAYSRGLWGTLPPLLLGRSCFDSALLHLARKRGAALVDVTAGVMAVHQDHSYGPGLGPGPTRGLHPEVLWNIQVAGGCFALASWLSATHTLERGRTACRLPEVLLPWWFPVTWVVENWRRHIRLPILRWTRPVRHLIGLRSSRKHQ